MVSSQKFSIKRRLTLLINAITSVSLLVMAGLFTLFQHAENKKNLIENLTTLATITGDNVEAAILFDNENDAEQLLAELQNDPGIISAAIYTPDDLLFSSFQTDRESEMELPLVSEGYYLEAGRLHIVQQINSRQGGAHIGTIHLQSSLESLDKQLQKNLFFTSVIVLVSLLIGYLLSHQLQRVISTPILELARITDRVRADKDYSTRFHRHDYTEIEVLCDGFNAMLKEIEARDEELLNMASYDPLTGLANRKFFSDMLSQTISRSKRKPQKLALLFVDLDRFKHVNDSLGHSVGDELLVQVAARFEHTIRGDDLVARLGGDEFTVLLQDVVSTGQVIEVAERIIEIMQEPYNLTGQSIVISPSIGIVLYPEHGDTVEQLMRNADTAMYESKRAGGNSYWFYSENMNVEAKNRLKLEESLRQAIQKNEIVVYYQPQLSLITGELVGMEALCRWKKDKSRLVSPGEFLPLADETGLIIPIGHIINESAVKMLKSLCDDGLYQRRLAINMSTRQFRTNESLERLYDIVHKAGINPDMIELEITEESLIGNDSETVEVMHQFREHGFHLAIDDFGTGYSSLSYLNKYPFDILKIDMSFVRGMQETERKRNIVKAIIEMSHQLDLTVVAEGVESIEQLNMLQEMGCDTIQGYYFCKPMDEDDLRDFLTQHNNRYADSKTHTIQTEQPS